MADHSSEIAICTVKKPLLLTWLELTKEIVTLGRQRNLNCISLIGNCIPPSAIKEASRCSCICWQAPRAPSRSYTHRISPWCRSDHHCLQWSEIFVSSQLSVTKRSSVHNIKRWLHYQINQSLLRKRSLKLSRLYFAIATGIARSNSLVQIPASWASHVSATPKILFSVHLLLIYSRP
jgi:hypothetical protein